MPKSKSRVLSKFHNVKLRSLIHSVWYQAPPQRDGTLFQNQSFIFPLTRKIIYNKD
jgi:hypothetical protein